jgi:hypothetical protein
MPIDEYSERFMFAANPIGQLLPMFAQGKFSEIELYEYGRERDWSDSVPSPPGIGLWVWEYKPTGGGPDYWGEYDAPDIDHGTWRPLTAAEWHFVQNGEPPWAPVIEAEEHEARLEELEKSAEEKFLELIK